jgi:tRNA pseudouridine55 synthase
MKSGFAFVDKPLGITSHDVVNQVRRVVGTKKVGHAGTLDPFATGLLILGINKATRLLGFLLGLDKSYRATMRLGATTDTDDHTGSITAQTSTSNLTETEIHQAFASHFGTRMQVPSAYSAKKIKGVKAYELARSGINVLLDAKEVQIFSLQIQSIQAHLDVIDVEFEVRCSSGTYIRAIARDIGEELGVGGHLRTLERTTIGDFALAEASSLNDLTLCPMLEICSKIMPTLEVDTDIFLSVQHGKELSLDANEGVSALVFDNEVVAIIENTQGIITYKAVLT